MKVTIIADDGYVYVDGLALKVDLTGLDPTIHAVQWDGTGGEIEYRVDAAGDCRPNEKISDLSPYQHFVDLWQMQSQQPVTLPTPAPRQPTTLSRRQMLMVLMKHNFITSDEAIAAATIGAVPSIVTAYISGLPLANQPAAKITWAAMGSANRNDPMLLAIATTQGVTSTQLDAFFVEGSAL